MAKLKLRDFELTGEVRKATTGEYVLVDNGVMIWEGEGQTSTDHIILCPKQRSVAEAGFSDRESIINFLRQHRTSVVSKILEKLVDGADYALRYDVKQFTDSDTKTGIYFCAWDTNRGVPAGTLHVLESKAQKDCDQLNSDFMRRMGAS